ncbi:hypothetical protein GH714_029080 [Hevea brasiliensis]|uniref:Polyadenylate-binding protein n=1 Tax=Hevea brasiliensis TaxID=3981 RepID=A0A6A6M5D0_HEVBR|nr:hypothetical protein GH714_029080 [Hevea brasiliensis]
MLNIQIYVKNLDPEISEEVLLEKFAEFGKIVSLVIAKDENGVSRGFGFVNFDNPDDARWAVERMNETELGSKVLCVGRAQKKAEREHILRSQFEEKRKDHIMKYKGSNVYVKNIDDEVTDEELKEHFSQCGTITSAKLMRDDKGISKGFGFVCFSMSEEANKAVSTFHGCMFHRKRLYVAIAQRKEDRQEQLQLQYAHCMAGIAGPSTAFIPGGYPRLYYTAPSGVVSQVLPGLMYQPLGMRPGWRANGFAPPTRPNLQPSQLPVMSNTQRQHKQNRGRINGHVSPLGGNHSVSYIEQPTQSPTSSKGPSNQRPGQAKYLPNCHTREVGKGSGVLSAVPTSLSPVSQGSEMLNSMLAAASPEEQKQILGEQLYPLIKKHQFSNSEKFNLDDRTGFLRGREITAKIQMIMTLIPTQNKMYCVYVYLQPDLVAKITGKLLGMDNSELLLLLVSPESLAAKVEEAVQVLKITKTKVSGQDTPHPSYLYA